MSKNSLDRDQIQAIARRQRRNKREQLDIKIAATRQNTRLVGMARVASAMISHEAPKPLVEIATTIEVPATAPTTELRDAGQPKPTSMPRRRPDHIRSPKPSNAYTKQSPDYTPRVTTLTERDPRLLPANKLTPAERDAEIARLEEEQRSDDNDYCDSTSTGPDDLSAELLAEERAYNRGRLRDAHTRDYEGIVPFDRTDNTSIDDPKHPFGNGMHIIEP